VKQNGFAPILILIAIVVVGAIGGAYYLGTKKAPEPQTSTTSSPAVQTTPSPSSTPDETADWKTYTNTKIGFVIKYPPNIVPLAISGLGLGPVDGNDLDGLEFGMRPTADGGLTSDSGVDVSMSMTVFKGSAIDFVQSGVWKKNPNLGCLPNELIKQEKINAIDALFYNAIGSICTGTDQFVFLTGKGYGFTFSNNDNWTDTELKIIRSFQFTN